MSTASLTLELPLSLKERLERLATSLKRSDEALAVEALDAYLAREEEFAAKIRKGIEAAERGDFAPAEKVEAFFQKWGDEG